MALLLQVNLLYVHLPSPVQALLVRHVRKKNLGGHLFPHSLCIGDPRRRLEPPEQLAGQLLGRINHILVLLNPCLRHFIPSRGDYLQHLSSVRPSASLRDLNFSRCSSAFYVEESDGLISCLARALHARLLF